MKRLDHDVRGLRKPAKELLPSRRVEVERNPTLVDVEVPVEEAALDPGLVVVEGRKLARHVAAGWLDSKNVCPQAREESSAIGAHRPGQVQDPETVQCAGGAIQCHGFDPPHPLVCAEVYPASLASTGTAARPNERPIHHPAAFRDAQSLSRSRCVAGGHAAHSRSERPGLTI